MRVKRNPLFRRSIFRTLYSTSWWEYPEFRTRYILRGVFPGLSTVHPERGVSTGLSKSWQEYLQDSLNPERSIYCTLYILREVSTGLSTSWEEYSIYWILYILRGVSTVLSSSWEEYLQYFRHPERSIFSTLYKLNDTLQSTFLWEYLPNFCSKSIIYRTAL